MRVLVLTLLAIGVEAAQDCFHGDAQLVEREVAQFCYKGAWKTVCKNSDWETREANLFCKQLGYSDRDASTEKICLPPVVNGYLRNTNCDVSENDLFACYYEIRNGCNEKCSEDMKRYHTIVQCSQANCTDEEVRLVGGTTDREGRVEVCRDGRWKAVCRNEWNENEVGLLCNKLGFASYGEEATEYPHRTPMLTCSIYQQTEAIHLECADITDCNIDLGVQCLNRELFELIMESECSTSDTLMSDTTTGMTTQANELSTVSSNCNSNTAATDLRMITNKLTQNSTEINLDRFNNSPIDCISITALGGVVGVLVVLVVILVIGWSLSCVVLVKRNSNTQKQTQVKLSSNSDESTDQQRHWDNPVYDTNMESHNYSSGGPTYELMDTNEGAGPTYSIQGQARENAYSNGTASTQDEEHNYHVLESGECEGVTGGGCDYEVPVSQQTHSQVMLCEEEYSTLKH